MAKSFKNRNTWDLIWQLFRSDFKLKYNDSILGFLWVLVKPFALFLIMYFILTKVFTNPDPNFPLYLLMGNMFIAFWNEGTNQGMDSFLGKANLITKVSFPRYIVIISSSLLALVNFFINISIFFVIAFIKGMHISLNSFLWFVFCTIVMYMLILVTSMFLSILYVKFRDLKQIWELFNQLIFWATPVIYSLSAVASRSKLLEVMLTKLNPISIFLTSGRSAILEGSFVFQTNVLVWFGIIIVAGYIGYFYYKSSIKRIAEFF